MRMRAPLAVTHCHEVCSTTELTCGTRQHDHTIRAIVLDLSEDFQQFNPHRSIDRILALGSVESDRHHAVNSVD